MISEKMFDGCCEYSSNPTPQSAIPRRESGLSDPTRMSLEPFGYFTVSSDSLYWTFGIPRLIFFAMSQATRLLCLYVGPM